MLLLTYNTYLQKIASNRFANFISSAEADDSGWLAIGKEANSARRKKDCRDVDFIFGDGYKYLLF